MFAPSHSTSPSGKSALLVVLLFGVTFLGCGSGQAAPIASHDFNSLPAGDIISGRLSLA